jgi:hypothetical protein
VTLNLTGRSSDLVSCRDQPIAQTLVIPFSMIVLKELVHGPTNGVLLAEIVRRLWQPAINLPPCA